MIFSDVTFIKSIYEVYFQCCSYEQGHPEVYKPITRKHWIQNSNKYIFSQTATTASVGWSPVESTSLYGISELRSSSSFPIPLLYEHLLARITCPVNQCPICVGHKCFISKETLATKNFTSVVLLVYNIDVNKV